MSRLLASDFSAEILNCVAENDNRSANAHQNSFISITYLVKPSEIDTSFSTYFK